MGVSAEEQFRLPSSRRSRKLWSMLSVYTVSICTWIQGRLCYVPEPDLEKAVTFHGSEAIRVLDVAMSTTHIYSELHPLPYLKAY